MIQIGKLNPYAVVSLTAIALILAMQIWHLVLIMDINTALSGILKTI